MLSFSNRLLSACLCAGVLSCSVGAAQAGAPAQGALTVRPISEQFSVAGQIQPEQLPELKARGYTSIVSFRPDKESADQPSAAQMEAAAKAAGLSFSYIPVSAGRPSDSQTSTLRNLIAGDSGKVLAYCRSGSRAARAWALAEASRPDGASSAHIITAVKAAGYSADDLGGEIDAHIAQRPPKL